MATDRDRFGHRLGKRFERVAAILRYSDEAAPAVLATYVARELRREESSLDELLLRALQIPDLRATLFGMNHPLMSDLAQSASASLPSELVLAAAKRAAHSGEDVIAAFVDVAFETVHALLRVQKGYKHDYELHSAFENYGRTARLLLQQSISKRLGVNVSPAHLGRGPRSQDLTDWANIRIGAL